MDILRYIYLHIGVYITNIMVSTASGLLAIPSSRTLNASLIAAKTHRVKISYNNKTHPLITFYYNKTIAQNGFKTTDTNTVNY